MDGHMKVKLCQNNATGENVFHNSVYYIYWEFLFFLFWRLFNCYVYKVFNYSFGRPSFL